MTSREKRLKQQEKRERRMERREQRSQDEQKLRTRRRIRTAGMSLLALVVVVALGFGYWLAFLQPRPGESVSTSGASDHSGRPAGGYSTSPPTSGPHSSGVPNWGEQNEIPEALQVHGLEHGGVLVQYNCPSGCPDLVSNLRSITGGYNSKVILAPYSQMESRIALTSWGQIDLMDEFDRERIEEFVKKNRSNAPENVP